MVIGELDSRSVERCSECGSSLLLRDPESAEVVCSKCGFVVSTKLANKGPEWRAFTPARRKERVRVGAPQTFMIYDKGLSTKIGWRDISDFAPEKKSRIISPSTMAAAKPGF